MNDFQLNDTFDNFSFSNAVQIEQTAKVNSRTNAPIKLNLEPNYTDSVSFDDSIFLSDSCSFSSFTNTTINIDDSEETTTPNKLINITSSKELNTTRSSSRLSKKTLQQDLSNSKNISEIKDSTIQSSNNSIDVSILEVLATTNNNLSSWGLPDPILQKYEDRNITDMFAWQVECLSRPGILSDHKNLVYSAPTSAGKTLVAEIIAIKTVMERQKKVLFILPFVSVVREKMFYFQDILGPSGIRVEGFMGSYNPPGGFRKVQVAICTIEKANSLVNRLLEEGKLNDIGAVIVDEMHLLGDPSRGYLLELLLTKLRFMSLKDEDVVIQIIGMSATLPNLSLLADWLDAELYTTDFRPIPLYEQCHVSGEIYDSQLKLLRKLSVIPELDVDTDNVLQLCLETIRGSCSVLIFCPTKNWCENLAQQIACAFWKLGSSKTKLGDGLRTELKSELISECLEQLKRCPVGLDQVLRKTVSFGVAFHHAGLTMDERDIIEGGFRAGSLRVLIATSTLSSGVNLPARRVIIRTPKFYGKPIDTLVYRQMIGRAGRMGRDTEGESILICQKTDYKVAKELMSANLQPIESCLEGAGKLKRAILEVITSDVASSPEEIELFTRCTLLACDTTGDAITNPIEDSLAFLIDNEFIRLQTVEGDKSKYIATSLAKACLSSSLPPEEGLALFTELEKARRCFVLETELHLIYLVTPYTACNQMGNINWMVYLDMWEKLPVSMKRVGELVGVTVSYIVNGTQGKIETKTSKLYHKLQVHKRFYTALALQDLVNEVPLNAVADKFGCNRGMLQSLQQSAATFAGMVTSFSKQLGWSSVEILVSQFQDRLQFGISRDLLDLMKLALLNGQRARVLFNAGIETLVDLANTDVYTLENILHKAKPFETEKEREGESAYDADKRNKLRTIWVTGKQGLTEKEAAELLVRDARTYLQLELGLCEARWDSAEKSDTTGENIVPIRIGGSSVEGKIIKDVPVEKTSKVDSLAGGCSIKGRISDGEETVERIRENGLITRISEDSSTEGTVTGYSFTGDSVDRRIGEDYSVERRNGESSAHIITGDGKAMGCSSVEGKIREDGSVKGIVTVERISKGNSTDGVSNSVKGRTRRTSSVVQKLRKGCSVAQKTKEDCSVEERDNSEQKPDGNSKSTKSPQQRPPNENIEIRPHSKYPLPLHNSTKKRDVMKPINSLGNKLSCQNKISSSGKREDKVVSAKKFEKNKSIVELDGNHSIIGSETSEASFNDSEENKIKTKTNISIEKLEDDSELSEGNNFMFDSFEEGNIPQIMSKEIEDLKTSSKDDRKKCFSATKKKLKSCSSEQKTASEHKMILRQKPNQSVNKPICPSDAKENLKTPSGKLRGKCNPLVVEVKSRRSTIDEKKLQVRTNNNTVESYNKNKLGGRNPPKSVDLENEELEISTNSSYNLFDESTEEMNVGNVSILSNYHFHQSEADLEDHINQSNQSVFEESFNFNSKVLRNISEMENANSEANNGESVLKNQVQISKHTEVTPHKGKLTRNSLFKPTKVRQNLSFDLENQMRDDEAQMMFDNFSVDFGNKVMENISEIERLNAKNETRVNAKNDKILPEIVEVSENNSEILEIESAAAGPTKNEHKNDFSKDNMHDSIAEAFTTDFEFNKDFEENADVIDTSLESPERNLSMSTSLHLNANIINTSMKLLSEGKFSKIEHLEQNNLRNSNKLMQKDTYEESKSIDQKKVESKNNSRKRVASTSKECVLSSIECSPMKKLKLTKPRTQRSSSMCIDETYVISTEKSHSVNESAIKEEEEDFADLTKFEIIDVCRDVSVFESFRKELLESAELSISLGCESYHQVKPVIGANIVQGGKIRPTTQDFVFKSIKVKGISVCLGGNTAFYIDLDATVVQKDKKINLLRNLFEGETLKVKMFDSKEQIKAVKQCCDLNFNSSCEDPKIGDWLLDPEGREKNLQALTLTYAPEAVKLCQMAGKSKGVGSVGLDLQSSIDARIRSSIECIVTWHLTKPLRNLLVEQDESLLHTYDIEMNCSVILSTMELNGFGVNLKEFQTLADSIKTYTQAIESKAYQIAGRRFSFVSSVDVAKILGIYRGKRVSTNKKVLEQSENPISDLIQLWRKLNSTLTKMVYPLLRLIENNRIYSRSITHSSTGRISMHEPNLQNIPRDFDFINPTTGKKVAVSCRRSFCAHDKNILVSADYCQLELRLLAHFSQDRTLCSIMKNDEDVFKSIAAKWNNVTREEVTDLVRQQTKQICYGIIYGMGMKTLADQLCVTEEEATEFTLEFHQKYPAIEKFISHTIIECRENGYVQTIAGRRRYLPHINDSSSTIKNQAERQAVNTMIQGSAADIAKNAMTLIENKVKTKFKSSRNKPKLVLHLHDELIYEIPSKYLEIFSKLLKRCMQDSVELSVPFPVKLKFGANWGEMKDYLIS